MIVPSSNSVRILVSTILLFLLLRCANSLEGIAARKCSRNSINLGKLIDTLLTDYDVHLLPEAEGVNVTIELHVQGISGISEITGDFSLDVMYSEIWQDPRLAFKHLNVCATNITLKSEFRKKIWTPDTCIINSKSSSVHSSPSENTYVILYENGLVWSNFRLNVKTPCSVNLKMFPFDALTCEIVLESYSFNTDEVRLLWHDVPITMMEKVELPDFDLIGWSTDHQRLEYPNGIWDRAKVKFTFARRYGFYLFQSYFPTSLTVISSWERERQIGSKVLGHWLNQIRKTRRNESRSNGDSVRKRVPYPEQSSNSPSHESSPMHSSTVFAQTANSVIHQKKVVTVDEPDSYSYTEDKKHGCVWNVVQRLVYLLCPPDRDWTITSVQILVNILHEDGSAYVIQPKSSGYSQKRSTSQVDLIV
ncbi:Neurotransmitter-gated ion-channel ligand binding domain protein [Oesophagostomum dentatum]|uniref:Neurotransmitter-gated ion-channel ligand binding domain protein n=1 Tax=Oesophagostomum dentatum TaxID=61180 RepID=A0A0B1T923_OESDE|nr:Neurotransmitter-gated ion-channel ligand binding domain protein [Oesophagostomum dentatum]